MDGELDQLQLSRLEVHFFVEIVSIIVHLTDGQVHELFGKFLPSQPGMSACLDLLVAICMLDVVVAPGVVNLYHFFSILHYDIFLCYSNNTTQ